MEDQSKSVSYGFDRPTHFTHQPTVPVTACTKPEHDQVSGHSRIKWEEGIMSSQLFMAI